MACFQGSGGARRPGGDTDAVHVQAQDHGFSLDSFHPEVEGTRSADGRVAVEMYVRHPCLDALPAVSYTHLRAHETKANIVCRLLLEKKKDKTSKQQIYSIDDNKIIPDTT